MLKRDDVRDAAINRVSETSLSFETDWNDGVWPFMLGNMVEEFGDVARSEHLVNSREVRRSLLGVKVRSEDTASDALPSQELARAARSSSTAAARVSATAHLLFPYHTNPFYFFFLLLANWWLGFWDTYGVNSSRLGCFLVRD